MLKGMLKASLNISLLCLCMLNIMSFLGRYGWFFDILSHFRIFFVGCFVLCLLFSLKFSPSLCVVWAAFLIFNLVPITHLYIADHGTAPQNPKLLMMTFNLEAINNHHFEKAVNCIKHFNPDIVSLQEIDDKFATYLKENLPQYPHYKLLPDSKYGGVGLLSKYPIEQTDVYNFGTNFPVIVSTIKTSLGNITVITVHPRAPYTPFDWENQKIFTDGIAQICRTHTGPIVLAGDLNTTAFGYQYARLLNLTELQDSNLGFGYQPTWPASLPVIDIDHFLMTKDLVAVARRNGPNILSDHLPLYVEISRVR